MKTNELELELNIKGFKNSFSLVDWDFISQDKNPENAYKNFLIKDLYIYYLLPMKTIRVQTLKHLVNPV